MLTPSDLRFGAFLSPIHSVRENPTLALHRDVEFVRHLDQLGYDEVWIGEHHSTGWEFVSSPEVFLSYAAARTERIRLGTGVVSLPYHNPYMVAERMVLLDHLTRGRAMLGVGPGALAYDAKQLGIDVAELRPRMEDGYEAVLALLRGERITRATDWFSLNDAALQLLPYAPGGLETAVAATHSPSGARLAGKYGAGMLSLTATHEAAVTLLSDHWKIVEEQASENGHVPSRTNWRLVGPMHIADSEEQAKKDVTYGLDSWCYYMTKVATLGILPENPSTDQNIDALVKSGFAVIGTPDQAIDQIQRLIDASGGFGTFLLWGHDWAQRDATLRSYEMLARHVFPAFQSSTARMIEAQRSAQEQRPELAVQSADARKKAADDYAAERRNKQA